MLYIVLLSINALNPCQLWSQGKKVDVGKSSFFLHKGDFLQKQSGCDFSWAIWWLSCGSTEKLFYVEGKPGLLLQTFQSVVLCFSFSDDASGSPSSAVFSLGLLRGPGCAFSLVGQEGWRDWAGMYRALSECQAVLWVPHVGSHWVVTARLGYVWLFLCYWWAGWSLRLTDSPGSADQ